MAKKEAQKLNVAHRKLHYALDTGCRIVEFDANNENHIRHLARYNFAASYCDGKTVLDMASGTGYGGQNILQHFNPEKFVIADISFTALKYAKEHYSKKLIPVCADGTLLPFSDESFDVFLSFETLEHIPEYRKYLSEIIRVLKSDGLAIISTPNKIYRSPYTKVPRNPFHYIEWRKNDFKSLLDEYFDDVKIYGQYVPKHFRILTFLAPLFDTTLHKQRFVRGVMVRAVKIVKKYFGGSKYTENNTDDFLKKHEVRTLSQSDQPEIFVAVCKKKGD